MIYTVTGTIEKEELGVTLSHEHIAWGQGDVEQLYFEKKYNEDNIANLYDLLIPVFHKLYDLGCRTVVEASPPRGAQNVKLMQKISKDSGVKLIANTGSILPKYSFERFRKASIEDIAKQWINDFNDGLDNVDDIVIRPSYIKIFMSDGVSPLPEYDKRILRAAMIASEKTGMPIHCHILEAKNAEEVIDLLEDESFDFNKFLWAHAGNEGDMKVIRKAISKGAWLGFDQIRPEYYEKFVSLIKEVQNLEYQDKVLLSQDYDFYEEVTKPQDKNLYVSIFTDFIPYCEGKGISKNSIMKMLTENPGNFYDIK